MNSASDPQGPATDSDERDGSYGAVDTGAIAWLLPEIVSAFDAATTALRAFRAGAAGVDRQDVDLAPLRVAGSHLHQAHGALELGEIAGVTRLTEAMEDLLGCFEKEPERCDATALDAITAGCRSIVEYLEDLLGGARQQPLYLFPGYRALLAARGVDRIHPADLFTVDLGVRAPRDDSGVLLDSDGLVEQRNAFEQALLRYIRNERDATALAALSRAVAAIDGSVAADANAHGRQRAFWWVVRALFEALANEGFSGVPAQHPHIKRLAGRVNLQIRKLVDGTGAVPERLFADTLFFVAIAEPITPHVRDVQERFALAGAVPVDFETQRYGRIDPVALRTARVALSAAKVAWAGIVSGDVAQLRAFAREIGAVTEAVGPIRRRGLAQVAQVIDCIATDLAFDPRRPSAAVALDVATALLFLEGSLERARGLDEAFDARAALMVERVEASALGSEALPAPVDWLDRMSREADEKLTLATFVTELQGTLRSAEKVLDAFFRDPVDRAGLADAQKALTQASGALALLGHDDAHLAIDHARASIARFERDETLVDQAAFEDLAQSLGAVGFYVEQIAQGRIDAAAFRFDAATGRFCADMARGTGVVADDDAIDALPAPMAPSTGTPSPAFDPFAEIDVFAFAATQIMEPDATVEDEIARRAADAQDHMARLRRHPDDAGALLRLKSAVDDMRRNAMLIDDRPLQDEAGAVLATLREDSHEPFAFAAAAELGDRVAALAIHANRIAGVASEPAQFEPLIPVPSEDDVDAELLEIFLEEAGDVLHDAEASMRVLDADPHSATASIDLRRGFHTLKGSGRMVGLTAFGDAAGSIEVTLDDHVAGQTPATADLRALIDYAIRYLGDWVGELRANGRSTRIPDALIEAARALRRHGIAAIPGEPDAIDLLIDEVPQVVDRSAHEEDVTKIASASRRVIEPDDGYLSATGMLDEDDAPIDLALCDVPGKEAPVEAIENATAVIAPFSPSAPSARSDDMRRIGPLTLSVALFDIYLNEADELLRILTQDFAEWRHELDRHVSERAIRAAHSLAGSSATVGLVAAHDLAAGLEEVLQALWREPLVLRDEQVVQMQDAVESLRRMLHRFAAERIPDADPIRIGRLIALRREITGDDFETRSSAPAIVEVVEAVDASLVALTPVTSTQVETVPLQRRAVVEQAGSSLEDDIDPDLLDIFVEEGGEILPQIGALLRTWQSSPADPAPARMLLRHLHTLKGSARMAGAMRLGEVVHDSEARVESAARLHEVPAALLEELLAAHDRSLELFDRLRRPPTAAPAVATQVEVADHDATIEQAAAAEPAHAPRVREQKQVSQQAVRVGSDTLDRLVNLAGEVSISRARIENEILQIKGAMSDLGENVERLRAQLREIELQAELQMQSQMQSQQAAGAERDQFDPLEFDRFTRFQELTRMMAESVDDVKTLQQHLQKSLNATETDLASQRRMTRDLQKDLMRVRMVPFSSIAERFYRVARQTAKEVDKRVNLDIRGGSVEIDRSVLERMAGPFEHLLRNHIVHGIESREERRAAGKDETGELLVEARQEGNEIVLTFSDDGAGLNHARIREKGRALGLLDDRDISDAQAAELIFHPGFSTAAEVTELAGRGVGMDVVRAEALVLGGRVSVDSEVGRGTRFAINLPVTLAITQVVLVAVASRVYAIPAVLVEQVRQLRSQPLADAYRAGHLAWDDAQVRLAFLGALLGLDGSVAVAQRSSPVLILRSAGERIAIHVDEVVGNQEVVVKNLGPQLARMSGIAGATVLGSGEIVLILNPVQLAHMARTQPAGAAVVDDGSHAPVAQAPVGNLQTLPTVMVVDDSLTVRRVTQRLLSREGYQVVLAKDGVDALEQLQDYPPDVMLVDIEMPRMDGFDLTRNVRNDERYRHIPIIMITSRTAGKHRRHAESLGVDAYLGKPYQEDELLDLLTAHLKAKRGHPA
ncbi:MAG: response regulator [Burkholderiaceae bacterium]